MARPAPWNEIALALAGSAELAALEARLGEGARATRLPAAAAAWVADVIAERSGRPVLAIVPHEGEARLWLESLALFAGGRRAAAFPAPSLSPYQALDASLQVRAEEVVALDGASTGVLRTLVATPRALFRRLPAAEALAAIELARGARLDPGELAARLTDLGYRKVDLVGEVGDFAVRGGLVDVFPPGATDPLRVDLFGDEIESLRDFDVASQRSLAERERARLLPLALFPEGPEAARRLGEILGGLVEEEPGLETVELLRALADGRGAPGWENLLPLAAPRTLSLAEWLERPLVVAFDPPALLAEVERHAERLAQEHAARRAHHRFALPPEVVELPASEVRAVVERAALAVDPLAGGGGAVDFGATSTDLFHGQLPRFPREVETARARRERVFLVAAPERFAALGELLEGREVPVGRGGVELAAGELDRGFRLPAARALLFGEAQLLARPAALARARKGLRQTFLGGLRDLKLGDYVVHADHGIGQFLGLRTVGAAPEGAAPPAPLAGAATAAPGGAPAGESEVMEIAYASGRRLLVPLARLDLIQKYSGIEGVAPRVDQLGGTSWTKTKTRVGRTLRDMAQELLKLYAERRLARAPILAGDSDLERQLAATFPYEETPDQADAIAAVYADLEQPKPMDRLLCGDVGFGKTEVAIRAAFRAVDSGYQVAVLAPTTILADQHLETFARRLGDLGVRVERLSRLLSGKELKTLLARVAAGQVDVLVGTHRILSKDVVFARLGLLVVDEEQRFGVAQKERLKQLKKDVHVLAMSATPLPRTLQLSLAGVRDISVIETPPKDRMAVETAVLPHSDELVREAIDFELGRGGQIYYVYNRVETIERMAGWLRELVPGLRITIGHGQLDERELYRRMHAFTAGEHDLLLASTIIENGIDIPTVNTMIVHRADRFGLAQLYQLRGRVGRGRELGYCYLLVEPDRALGEEARKRLEALREFTELGAGFRIAGRDLEIRGAGNLLGAEQSGHIAEVGIETYLKMLEETLAELKGERVEEGPSVQLDLPVPMAIPRDYVADESLRLEIYRRLATAERPREELAEELTDRFGPPPAEVLALLEVAALKRRAEQMRVQAISAAGGRLTVRLRRDARVEVDKLIRLVASRPGASFSPSGVLTLELARGADVVAAARAALDEVAA